MRFKNGGLSLVIAAYIIWGLLPLYWKLLGHIPAFMVLCNRIIWSVLFLGVLLLFRGKLKEVLTELRELRVFKWRLLSALLLSLNWLLYVWAMGKGYFLEAGLGYFLSPLFSLVLAAFFLKELVSKTQWLAFSVVVCGILVKIVSSGVVPWLALLLGGTWSLYTTSKKKQKADPVSSIFQEVLVVLPLAMLSLFFLRENLVFDYDLSTLLLLATTGPITVVPIIMLVQGLKSVSLRDTAAIQFITPTLSVVLAVIAGDYLSSSDWIAFGFIWSGITIYVLSFYTFKMPLWLRITRAVNNF